MPKKKIGSKIGRAVVTPVKGSKKIDSKYDPAKEIADLKVECVNKDKTIQEYEKQIEEMKDEILKLEKEIEELGKQQMEMETRHKRDMDEMVNDILRHNFLHPKSLVTLVFFVTGSRSSSSGHRNEDKDAKDARRLSG